MSFLFQLKCLSERFKDTILRGKSVLFRLSDSISFNIDSRSLISFANFLNSESKREIDNFISLTKNKTCLLDIGAYHGLFSLVFTANCPWKSAYAFDPSPRVFDFLAFNAKVNPGNNIKVHKCIMGDADASVLMKFESINQLSAIGKNESVKKSKQVRIIEAETIDQFVKKNSVQPDVIKIDTEGFEYQVLRGGGRLYKKLQPVNFSRDSSP